MVEPKALRALSRLLSYPDDRTVEVAELLYVILMNEVPEAAEHVSAFGAFVEQHLLWELEEEFTRTFDVNPACALEVGWHLFGEEYARGMFLVRMREEMRKYGIAESAELPDHITHVLSVIEAMPPSESARFVTACVLPALRKMNEGLADKETPYRHAVACCVMVMQHAWGGCETRNDDVETTHRDINAIPGGVDPLHAIPVAGVPLDCGSSCNCSAPVELVQLSSDVSHGGQEP